MLCKVHNRERIREDRIYTLEQTAIRCVLRLMQEYRNFSGDDLHIRYLSLDIQEDLTIDVSAYSVDKMVANFAPDSLEMFTFALRYSVESDLFYPVEDVHDWCRRIASSLHKQHAHWRRVTSEDLKSSSKAYACAYLLNKMCVSNMQDEVCIALLKVLNLQEGEA